MKKSALVIGDASKALRVTDFLIGKGYRVSIISKNRDDAKRLAQAVPATVLWGDATLPEILQESGMQNADIALSLLPADEDNFVASLLCKRVLSLTWGEWDCWWHEHWVWHSGGEDEDGYWCDHGWWQYAWLSYSASLTTTLKTKPDDKSPTASGKTMKSGYGLNASVSAQVRSSAPSSHITGVQNVVAYFPEFDYTTYWRLLKRLNIGYSSTFEFQKNKYSTYGRSVHFTPVWFPDGRYTTCLPVTVPVKGLTYPAIFYLH